MHTEFTDREEEVVELLLQGMSNTEIAAVLGITHSTSKFHVGNILSKLEVANRTQAVLKVLELRKSSQMARG